MVKFDASEKVSREKAICEIYAIHGRDGCGKEILLVIGETDGSQTPVMDLSSIIHYTRLYPPYIAAFDVCEDLGIVPETATYFDNYKHFTLSFCGHELED